MRRRGWKKYGIGAGGMLVLVMAILLATGWGSAVAAQISSVFVTNDAAHAVPVREQNLDGGNIKVHEEGTANVNVTNSSLSVASPAPVTGGGGWVQIYGANFDAFSQQTASALIVGFNGGAYGIKVFYQGQIVAGFAGGAARDGRGETVFLALPRPIKFDRAECEPAPNSATAGTCDFGWVGTLP